MTKNDRVSLQETYSLPGYPLYGGAFDKDIVIRAMTTVEEKMRLAGTGFEVIPNLIGACIVSPENIDVSSLKLFDIQYLMYKLRTVTYGNDYHINLTCPHCGQSLDMHIDLDELDVVDVPEDFAEPFEIGPLPVSGDTLTCKIPSIQEYLEVIKEAKRIKKKTPNYVGDPEFILTYQSQISKVNGETKEPFKLRQYVEQMHARDMRYLDSKYEELTSSFGLDTFIMHSCEHCGEDVTFDLPVTEEFFRPVY